MNSGSSQFPGMLFVFAQPWKTSPQIPTEVQLSDTIRKTNSRQFEATGIISCECRARLWWNLTLHWALPKRGDQQQTPSRVSESSAWFFKSSPQHYPSPALCYFHKPSNDHHITKFGAREGKNNIGQTAVSSNEANEAAFTDTDTEPDPFITQIPFQ